MRTKSLLHVYGAYVRRSQALDSRLAVQLPINPDDAKLCEPVHRDALGFLAIRLQHLWGEFCRELVVRSALGNCSTRSGQHVPPAPGAQRVRDLPAISRLPFSGRGTFWEDPTFALRQARRLKVFNYNSISLGLSSVATVVYDLKTVRNFITHPNRTTAAEYAQLSRASGSRGLTPEQFLRQLTPGGATNFETWTRLLTAAAWNAVT